MTTMIETDALELRAQGEALAKEAEEIHRQLGAVGEEIVQQLHDAKMMALRQTNERALAARKAVMLQEKATKLREQYEEAMKKSRRLIRASYGVA